MQSTKLSASRRQVASVGVLLACCAVFAGCATHTVSLTGVCYDKNGAPRPDVTVKPVDVSGRGFSLSPGLPKITETGSAKTNSKGEFAVSFEAGRYWMLDVQFGSGELGSRARLSPSKEVANADKAAVKITIDDGALESVWEKR